METNKITSETINTIAKNFKERFPNDGFVVTDDTIGSSSNSKDLINISGLRVKAFNKK